MSEPIPTDAQIEAAQLKFKNLFLTPDGMILMSFIREDIKTLLSALAHTQEELKKEREKTKNREEAYEKLLNQIPSED